MEDLEFLRYPLPDFMEGKCTEATYAKWLRNKAKTLFDRDVKHKKPFVHGISPMQYSQAIHNAVVETGLYDPYTGDELRWDLIGAWDTGSVHADSGKYKKEFALMPTVDHIDPEATTLELEICSWQANDCKTDLNPAEFVAFCAKVVEHCGGKDSRRAKKD